jgi:hypothetical protein
MRVPRVRFTIRRMMGAVVVVALFLVVASPVAKSLIWLYHTPNSINGIDCDLGFRVLQFGGIAASVGRPVPVPFLSECESDPHAPPGLPYRVAVEVKLINVTTGNVRTGPVEETHETTHLLVTGIDSWRRIRRELDGTVTPRHPGRYVIRYEVHATDLFGRSGTTASYTDWLNVR